MTRMLLLLGAIAGVFLTALPAQAQRVFVSGSGSDSNPCTFAAPCRSFQQAFNTVTAVTTSGGEIDVLDPAGYGPLTITHGISIQAHGFGGITQTSGGGYGITISAGASDAITLNGLLIDGGGTGFIGVHITSGGTVQILNCVVRHFFSSNISYDTSTTTANLLIEDTVASDSSNDDGIQLNPSTSTTPITLSRITANRNNGSGVSIFAGQVMIAHSVLSNNGNGVLAEAGSSPTWLGNSVVSGNVFGVMVDPGSTLNSYGNNAINGNGTTDVSGTLTPVSTR